MLPFFTPAALADFDGIDRHVDGAVRPLDDQSRERPPDAGKDIVAIERRQKPCDDTTDAAEADDGRGRSFGMSYARHETVNLPATARFLRSASSHKWGFRNCKSRWEIRANFS